MPSAPPLTASLTASACRMRTAFTSIASAALATTKGSVARSGSSPPWVMITVIFSTCSSVIFVLLGKRPGAAARVIGRLGAGEALPRAFGSCCFAQVGSAPGVTAAWSATLFLTAARVSASGR